MVSTPESCSLLFPSYSGQPLQWAVLPQFPWEGGIDSHSSGSFSLQQGGHGDPGPPGAPVSDGEALPGGGGTGIGPH